MKTALRTVVIPALAGVLFALGLGVAGMTQPAKVIAFLDVFGAWDPSLMFVMLGALAVHLPFVQWQRRRGRTVAAAELGAALVVDRRLLLGAALFGVGWGLSGYCPGPAFVSLAHGTQEIFLFVAAMFVGMFIARRYVGART